MLNRSTEAGSSTPKSQGSSGLQAPLLGLPQGLPPVPPMAVIPQQLITAGTRKDCIRLRGLPYESQVRLLPVLPVFIIQTVVRKCSLSVKYTKGYPINYS